MNINTVYRNLMEQFAFSFLLNYMFITNVEKKYMGNLIVDSILY